MKNMNKKVSTRFKIIGFCGLLFGIVLIILACTAFAKPAYKLDEGFPRPPGFPGLDLWVPKQNNSFLIFLGIAVCMISLVVVGVGFIPQIYKLKAHLVNETMDVAGDDISTAMNRTAQVASPAITTLTKGVKAGLNNGDMHTFDAKYCANCGKHISQDSKFCKYCGGAQN